MGAEFEEREILALLERSGAKKLRRGSGNVEVWQLKNGAKFFANIGPGGHRERRALKNNLSQLKRMLGPEALKEVRIDGDLRAGVEVVAAMQAAKVPTAALADVMARPAAFIAQIEGKKFEGYQCAVCGVRHPDVLQRDACIESHSRPKEQENKVKVLPMNPPTKQEEKKEEAAAPTRKHPSWRTAWTPAQDKIVIEGYEAKFSPREIAQLIQAERPGCTAEEVASRAAGLRAHYKALGPGYPKAIVEGPPSPPAAPAPAPEAKAAPLAAPAPTPAARPGLARVTFEIGGKTRVVEVDEETARSMLRAALEL